MNRTTPRGALPGLALLAASAALLGGCRYSTADALPPEVRTIAVTRLRNETSVPGLEAEITAAIISGFQCQRRLEVVSLADHPDLILTGAVDSYGRGSIRTDKFGDPVAMSVEVRASVTVHRADGTDLIGKMSVSSQETEPTSGQVRMTAGRSEAMGRAEAVEDLGRNIVRRVLGSGW